ncbi:MAG: hydroxymethylglutaryl-CoA reductase, degradative [Legionellales bacterium RIFCSPHIGHO2_12_FULL_35_11]|nr:MAG: hydroxymethylglutaryl-CoA reductase, degradative [Legionellales bacterium RIFCSPHIGHO2_12_FULL_35_11]
MSLKENTGQLFKGFSKLTRNERFARLCEMGALSQEDVSYLTNGGLVDINLADKLIENVIGYFQLPLGVATNLNIDDQDYVVPMAVEETSIIAALSKTARFVRQNGKIVTRVEGDCIIGQIQLANVNNFERFSDIITQNKQFLIEKANEDIAASMVKRGGGVRDLKVRKLIAPNHKIMAVIHLTMNSCDAMGANIINQVLEHLKEPIENLTNETVSMCILSNLNDEKLTHVRVEIENVDEQLGIDIENASIFAESDPYRAATSNKGVMNGMDPILIATGNDWRAVEAGVHAYASRTGQYQSITKWRYKDNLLVGEMIAPIVVGIVGGVTSIHPTAQLCLKMMQIKSSDQLARVVGAVGLLQNLGAIRALCTEGIIQGHMKLHLDNLLIVAGATDSEVPALKKKLQKYLSINKKVSLNKALEFLAEIRNRQFAL